MQKSLVTDKSMGFTPFQNAFIEEIEKRPLFQQWCLMEGDKNIQRKPGPIVLTWYEKNPQGGNDKLHARRLGQKRFLREEMVAK